MGVCVLCRDSCQRGWRLLYILTAFHRCSDVMKPFLLKFLQDACAGPGVQYQGRKEGYSNHQSMTTAPAFFLSDVLFLC